MKTPDVAEEYKKNKELNVEDINALKEWAQKQTHLPPISEFQLILFLHSCYWSLEQTKITIDKFFTYRSAWPDFFANRNPQDPKLQSDIEVGLTSFLKTRTPENYKILFYKIMDLDVNRFSAKDLIKVFDMCIMLELMQKGTFDGVVIVVDFKNLTVGHLLKTHITEMSRLLLYLQNALPVRLKGLHYVTSPAICELVVPLVKPFIKKELLEYLKFHNSYESLTKSVPQALLPQDIGGKEPSTMELHEEMQKSLFENEDYFVEEEGLISNEKLRDRRPSFMDRDLGIGTDGSFRKLSID